MATPATASTAAPAASWTSGRETWSSTRDTARRTTLPGLTRWVSVSMVRARSSLVRSICLTSVSGSRSATSPFASAITSIPSSRNALTVSLSGRAGAAHNQGALAQDDPAGLVSATRPAGSPGSAPGQVLRLADLALASGGQAAGVRHRGVLEGGRLEVPLDLARQRVPGQFQLAQRLVGRLVGLAAGALDSLGRGLQGRGPEIADARVELLVALPERGDALAAQRRVRVGQDLGNDPAVVLVVVLQSGEVQHGRPDVGLVEPRTRGVAAGNGDLPAVRARGVRAFAGGGAVHPEVLDPGELLALGAVHRDADVV